MENVNRKLGILAVIKTIFGNNDIKEIDIDDKDLLDAQNRADRLAVRAIVEEGVRNIAYDNGRKNLKIKEEIISMDNIKLSGKKDENKKYNKDENEKDNNENERI